MEESLQSTLLLAQRTADEVKASAHKEADLIKQEARLRRNARSPRSATASTKRGANISARSDTAEKAKSELRSLLMSHLSLIERGPFGASAAAVSAAPPPAVAAAPAPAALPEPPPRPVLKSETDEFDRLPLNGATERRIVQ